MNEEYQTDLLDKFDEGYSELVTFGHAHGPVALNGLLQLLGGQKKHIPKPSAFWDGLAREIRNEEIRLRFTGNNLADLSQDYDLTERQLREIVRTEPKRYARPTDPLCPAKLLPEKHEAIAVRASEYGVSRSSLLDAIINIAFDDPDFEDKLAARMDRVPLKLVV